MNLISPVGTFLIIGVGMYFILKKFGLISPKSKEQKQIEKTIDDKLKENMQSEGNIARYKWLDPNKYVEGSPLKIITDEKALSFAKRLSKALTGWWFINPTTWGDDELEVYSVFREIPNVYSISLVAKKYLDYTGESLRERILSDLDASELANLYNILKTKPL